MDGPSLVFIPIFKYLVSRVLHGNLLCRHLQIIFISTAVILPKLYDVYIVHNIELQCWYLAMHPKTHGKVVEIASVPFFVYEVSNTYYPAICKHVQFIEQRWNTRNTDAWCFFIRQMGQKIVGYFLNFWLHCRQTFCHSKPNLGLEYDFGCKELSI